MIDGLVKEVYNKAETERERRFDSYEINRGKEVECETFNWRRYFSAATSVKAME